MTGYDKAAAAKNEYKDGLNVSESSNKSADKNTENIKLLKRVKQGDAAARDELINGNVGVGEVDYQTLLKPGRGERGLVSDRLYRFDKGG